MGTLILGLLIFYIILLIIFNPRVDKLPNGDTIVWFNSGGKIFKSRDYIVIKRNN